MSHTHPMGREAMKKRDTTQSILQAVDQKRRQERERAKERERSLQRDLERTLTNLHLAQTMLASASKDRDEMMRIAEESQDRVALWRWRAVHPFRWAWRRLLGRGDAQCE